MTGGIIMRKFAVMVLAVMLVSVMAAGAWASMELTFRAGENYVGEEPNASIAAFLFNAIHASYYFYIVEGELPPNTHLEQEQLGSGVIFLRGTLTASGHYSFTVGVTVEGKDGYEYSRLVQCEMDVLPARNTSGDNPTPAPVSPDIPAPAPIPSRDVPAPTPDPDPKPESLRVIAQKLGTTSDNVNYIASSDMAAPQAPTSRIINALDILGLEIISTQGSLNVNQSGYYAFPLTVPATLVGTNTELKVYLADRRHS